MRHGKKFNHLGRKVGHRKALLRNLAIALVEHKRINTTLAKAKALRRFIEPIITKSKTASTHNMRVVFSYLQNKETVKELFGPIAAKIGDRPGGYVRVIKTGFRKGDGAETAMIELVDFNEIYNPNAEAETKTSGRKRRRRRGGKSGGDSSAAVATTTAAEAEEEVEEVEETLEEVENAVEEVEDAIEETASEEEKEESPENSEDKSE